MGDSFICRCKDSFIGEDSADGDGCFRTSMRTIGTGMDKGLHITVGQGADVFVHAGGEIRGRSAGIFAMVDSLEALLEQTGVNAAAIARNKADADASQMELDRRLSDGLQRLSDDMQALVDDEITAAKAFIAANTAAIAANGAAITAEIQRAQLALAQEASRARDEDAAIRNVVDAAGTLAQQASTLANTANTDIKGLNARVSSVFYCSWLLCVVRCADAHLVSPQLSIPLACLKRWLFLYSAPYPLPFSHTPPPPHR